MRRKLLASLLALCLLVSMLPMAAMAEELENPSTTPTTVACAITATNITKAYDGNKDVTSDIMVAFSKTADSTREAVTLQKDTDYTVTAEYADANVGNDKAVTVTVVLKNTDYNFEVSKEDADPVPNPKYTTEAACVFTAKGAITKAARDDTNKITISPTTLELEVEKTGTVKATGTTGDVIKYSSGTPAVATVNETTGEVTAVSAGTATITATATNNNYADATAACAVTVKSKAKTPAELELTPGTSELKEDETDTTKITGYAVALIIDGWSGSDGEITVKCDDSTIQVSGSNHEYSCKLPAEPKTYTFTATIAETETHAKATATCAVTITENGKAPEHNHMYTDWKTNETHHWLECTVAGCDPANKKGYAEHTFTDGVCTVCGYTQGGGTTTPTNPVTPPSGGNTGSTTTTTTETATPTVSNGTATTEVSTSQANALVQGAQNTNASEVTVKVEPTGGTADTVEVSLPASSVSSLGSQTSAALTLETPVADVTIPSESLTQLGQSASKVTVTAQKNEDTVSITVKKDNTVVTELSRPMTATVPATNAASGMVAVIVNPDGTETIIKKSVAGDGEIAMQLNGSATIKVIDNTKSFTDTANDWSKAGIEFASSHELFQGTSATTFSPNNTMTRGMLVTVLHRLEDTPAGGSVSFDDVKPDDYFADAVAWANQNDIAQGTGAGFNPGGDVTRQDLATFLYRYASKFGVDTKGRTSLTGYGDSASVSTYAKDAMEWCINAGLIQGKGDSTLDPTGNAKRSEVATILMRFVQYINNVK